MTVAPVIREPAVAGLFYPSRPVELKKDIEQLLHDARPTVPSGSVRALICPHAGYIYSGSTAAMGYKLLASLRFDSVVVVGPSHREYFPGMTVFPGEAYRTPLGDVLVDTELRDELLKHSKEIVLSDAGHRKEHAIEVQLPFLQHVQHNAKFLPVVMGDQRRSVCDALSDALTECIGNRNVLLVASSDLSHYHHHEEAVKLDSKILDDIESFNPDRLLDKLERHDAEACGGGPMVAVMKTARRLGATTSHVIQYCTSGDISGEKGSVVGYLAAAFTGAS
ncbi:MAG: AmmeMemoRadiSam system protein B [Ignavibacteriae bacterium]|nr:AmmeMemoRadiSam system protein B [Ignavibacteriota bacterium]